MDGSLYIDDMFDAHPLIIGVTGKAGSGKNTVADLLCAKYANVYSEAFASALKDAAANLYRINRADFDEPALKEKRNRYWNKSPREIAQYLGTEIVREHFGKDHWIWLMHGKLTGLQLDPEVDGAYTDTDVVIITDVRFDNEAEWILENGGYLIHLTREGADGKVGIVEHVSESGLSANWYGHRNCYSISNNGTLKELENAIELLIDTLKVGHRFIFKPETSIQTAGEPNV